MRSFKCNRQLVACLVPRLTLSPSNRSAVPTHPPPAGKSSAAMRRSTHAFTTTSRASSASHTPPQQRGGGGEVRLRTQHANPGSSGRLGSVLWWALPVPGFG
jgi:hypothetical protein